jgi:hypothetical protein
MTFSFSLTVVPRQSRKIFVFSEKFPVRPSRRCKFYIASIVLSSLAKQKTLLLAEGLQITTKKSKETGGRERDGA